MKINAVKTIISVGIAILLSLICYKIAPQEDYRNWISLGVACVTLTTNLILAMGINYNSGTRNMNIKLVAAIGVIITLIGNIAFSCFTYPVLIYIAVMGIITLLIVASVIGLSKPVQHNQE